MLILTAVRFKKVLATVALCLIFWPSIAQKPMWLDETRNEENRLPMRPSVSKLMTCFNLTKSVDFREYAGETGEYGIPICNAASANKACSILFSLRIAMGRVGETSFLSKASAMHFTALNVSL